MKEKKKAKPKFERTYKILEYLKKNSDELHPVEQRRMRKDPMIADYLGDKGTFNRTIKEMARVLNADDEAGYKREEDWKLYFDDFRKRYGDSVDEFDLEDDSDDWWEDEDKDMHLDGLYYKRTFSYEEINDLIDGIWANRTLDSKAAEALVKKVEENLTTKFYKKGPKQICKVQEPELADRGLLKQNMWTIQKAIDNNVQIRFQFNGYTCKKKLEPIRKEKDTVSPYYIVASGGRYYLLACKEIALRDGNVKRDMSIWRIDLMTDVEIPDANEKLGIPGIKRIPKRDVKNLPTNWNEDFQLSHLNMSYDEPVDIKLRVTNFIREDDPYKNARASYTFLHDWFGDTFRYIRAEQVEPFGDIVTVKCSPYAMVNWALQYSDRVEVLEPESVRQAVVEKIKRLNRKYAGGK